MRNGRCPKCGARAIATSQVTLYQGQGVAGPTLDLFACAECRLVETYLHDDPAARVDALDSWRWVHPDEGPFR